MEDPQSHRCQGSSNVIVNSIMSLLIFDILKNKRYNFKSNFIYISCQQSFVFFLQSWTEKIGCLVYLAYSSKTSRPIQKVTQKNMIWLEHLLIKSLIYIGFIIFFVCNMNTCIVRFLYL